MYPGITYIFFYTNPTSSAYFNVQDKTITVHTKACNITHTQYSYFKPTSYSSYLQMACTVLGWCNIPINTIPNYTIVSFWFLQVGDNPIHSRLSHFFNWSIDFWLSCLSLFLYFCWKQIPLIWTQNINEHIKLCWLKNLKMYFIGNYEQCFLAKVKLHVLHEDQSAYLVLPFLHINMHVWVITTSWGRLSEHFNISRTYISMMDFRCCITFFFLVLYIKQTIVAFKLFIFVILETFVPSLCMDIAHCQRRPVFNKDVVIILSVFVMVTKENDDMKKQCLWKLFRFEMVLFISAII